MEQTVKAYDFVHDLERLEDGKQTTLCKSIYELYKVLPGKKTYKAENIVPDIGRGYFIYSGFSDRYYERTLKGEHELDDLKLDIEEGSVHLLWDKGRQEEIKQTMSTLYKYYHKAEGSFSYYTQHIPLIKNTLEYADYRQYSRESIGFYTQCKKYEDKQKLLIWSQKKD